MIDLSTPRLRILTLDLDNAQTVADMITEKVSRWTSPIPWPYRLEDAKDWLANTSAEKRLGIYLESALIGTTSMPAEDGDEVGFWIHENYEGKGFATETAAAIVTYAFTHKALQFIDSCVHRDNAASRRVHEKLGFSAIGETERYWPNKKANVPVILYRLNKNDWHN